VVFAVEAGRIGTSIECNKDFPGKNRMHPVEGASTVAERHENLFAQA